MENYLLTLWEILTSEQLIIIAVILGSVGLFIWNHFRYDLVAIVAFLIIALAGLVELDTALANFGHPAVIIVGSMFILSKAVTDSGVIEIITRRITTLSRFPTLQLFLLCAITALASGFINNIGALAIMIPVAVHMARQARRSVSMYLLPLAFSSHLGGFLTLIGSPRNVIISAFRVETPIGEQFAFFDFIYVGGIIAVIGLFFLTYLGWSHFRSRSRKQDRELFDIYNYTTEARVPENSPLVGKQTKEISGSHDQWEARIVSLQRKNISYPFLSGTEVIQPDDVLTIEAEPDTLNNLTEINGLILKGEKAEENLEGPEDERIAMEATIPPTSRLLGRSWKNISLALKFGVNLLAVARHSETVKGNIENLTLRTGDILLLSGKEKSVHDTISRLNLYPLAGRSLLLGRKLSISLSLIIFFSTITLAIFDLLPLPVTFLLGAVLVLLLRLVPIKQAYSAIDWPVLIMLGAMITLGEALKSTGANDTIAAWIDHISLFFQNYSPTELLSPELITLALTLLAAILISNLVSTTSSAVIMAPIAISLAEGLTVQADALLMAVAIGAAFAFLTPASHESNALVMQAGEYSTFDYIKMGLPLQILIFISALILIPIFWPL